jgi:hypothetical protein
MEVNGGATGIAQSSIGAFKTTAHALVRRCAFGGKNRFKDQKREVIFLLWLHIEGSSGFRMVNPGNAISV